MPRLVLSRSTGGSQSGRGVGGVGLYFSGATLTTIISLALLPNWSRLRQRAGCLFRLSGPSRQGAPWVPPGLMRGGRQRWSGLRWVGTGGQIQQKWNYSFLHCILREMSSTYTKHTDSIIIIPRRHFITKIYPEVSRQPRWRRSASKILRRKLLSHPGTFHFTLAFTTEMFAQLAYFLRCFPSPWIGLCRILFGERHRVWLKYLMLTASGEACEPVV